jgi:hypothetical protein
MEGDVPYGFNLAAALSVLFADIFQFDHRCPLVAG